MSGYNRKDVNAYIIDINRKFEEQEAELRTQITAAEDRAAQSESAAQSVREKPPPLYTPRKKRRQSLPPCGNPWTH